MMTPAVRCICSWTTSRTISRPAARSKLRNGGGAGRNMEGMKGGRVAPPPAPGDGAAKGECPIPAGGRPQRLLLSERARDGDGQGKLFFDQPEHTELHPDLEQWSRLPVT